MVPGGSCELIFLDVNSGPGWMMARLKLTKDKKQWIIDTRRNLIQNRWQNGMESDAVEIG